eukprot:SAG31_NODE_28422_length_410_cov_1.231511_2_plen_74_part_01
MQRTNRESITCIKAAGGKLDLFVVDDEQGGMMHSWHIAPSNTDPCGRAKVISYFLVFVPTVREIRDFYREMQRT